MTTRKTLWDRAILAVMRGTDLCQVEVRLFDQAGAPVEGGRRDWSVDRWQTKVIPNQASLLK